MNRGVILFAFNSPKYNYYNMAKFSANRINEFLNLPVTLVTDEETYQEDFSWDNVVKITPDKNNFRDWGQWINKGRYMAYELSPYDETLLLDVDYIVNSNKLINVFDFYDGFSCHNKTSFIMHDTLPQEVLSVYSMETLWATVVAFRKCKKSEQIFKTLEMVQKNYNHYANIHNFISITYRNDYALTLALRIVNGHLECNEEYIPWNLLHIGNDVSLYKNSSKELDTEFTVFYNNWQRGKIRKEYITIKDMDFHIINKDDFVKNILNE